MGLAAERGTTSASWKGIIYWSSRSRIPQENSDLLMLLGGKNMVMRYMSYRKFILFVLLGDFFLGGSIRYVPNCVDASLILSFALYSKSDIVITITITITITMMMMMMIIEDEDF